MTACRRATLLARWDFSVTVSGTDKSISGETVPSVRDCRSTSPPTGCPWQNVSSHSHSLENSSKKFHTLDLIPDPAHAPLKKFVGGCPQISGTPFGIAADRHNHHTVIGRTPLATSHPTQIRSTSSPTYKIDLKSAIQAPRTSKQSLSPAMQNNFSLLKVDNSHSMTLYRLLRGRVYLPASVGPAVSNIPSFAQQNTFHGDKYATSTITPFPGLSRSINSC